MYTTSEAGLNLIKEFEGFKAEPYYCPGGKLTIGYGTTKGVTEDMRVTQNKADLLLRRDVYVVELFINGRVRVKLNQNQFDALVSFVYNVGLKNFIDSTLLKNLNAGRYDLVPRELKKWIHAKGKPELGLIKRRQKEAELFCKT